MGVRVAENAVPSILVAALVEGLTSEPPPCAHVHTPAPQPDILVNYPRSTFVSIVRIAVSLLVIFSYPLQSHPARRCLLTMYTAVRFGKESERPPSTVEFYAVTGVFLVASFVVAMSVSNLGTVLELVGATGSTAVSYILPGAIYWRLHPHPHPLRYVAAVQFSVGCCIVPIALTFILS
mmetsp:Transcript_8784/g.26488  ORF Transcript_8784/g.26488 Transcript_8784/m.26488 type:complete len:179 (-) Transcript_8784:1115-1651(-)